MDTEQMSQHAGEAAKLMKALANEKRLMVLCNLAGREMAVGELLKHVPLSQSALSQHLAVLRHDGLVRTRREAQTIYYSLNGDRAERIIELLYRMYCSPASCPR